MKVFKKRTIATIEELKTALGTSVDITVFRKLKELEYCTSYSHRGRYYALTKTARFDRLGLWSYRSVWFSRFGTLLSTTESFVNNAEAGYFTDELERVLHVRVREPLLKLVRECRIARERVFGRYLYCSSVRTIGKRQVLTRKAAMTTDQQADDQEGLSDEVEAAVVLLFSLLNEKERRLYAGLESLKRGRGGDQRIAQLLDIDVATVAKGRRQLRERDIEIDRVRRRGGGRKPLEKKRRRSSRRSES